MCGIFGCLVKINPNLVDIKIVKIIYDALSLLKNRGYDSCGIYLRDIENNNITLKYGVDGEIIKTSDIKDIFKLLEMNIEKYNDNIYKYNIGIGHTRWATHGGKTDENSHPHTSNAKKFTLVHNGIISNCEDIKKKYLSDYNFISKTDTEVIVNLIEFLYVSKSTE